MFRNLLMALGSLLVAAPAFAAEQSHSAKGLKEVIVTAIDAETHIEFWDRNTIEVEVPDTDWPDTVVLQPRGTALEISTAGDTGTVDVHVKDCVDDDCTESGTGPRAIFMHEGSEDPIMLDLDQIGGDENVWVKKIGDDDGQVIIEKKEEDGKTVIIKRRVVKGDDIDVDMDMDMDVEVVGEDEDVVVHGGKDGVHKRVIIMRDHDDVEDADGSRRRKEVRVRVKRKHGDTRDLDEVKSITVRMPRNLGLFANTVNGGLEVGNGEADARLTTVNGALEVKSYEGDLTASTISGPLSVARTKGRLNARTVSGTMQIEDARGDVKARTVSGKITYQGDLPRASTCSISTTSGAVRFMLPRNQTFNYDIDTFHGQVSGKAFQIPSNSGRVVGTAGSTNAKSPTVKVETVSGPVVFEER